jgi:hypothetical protein
MVTALILLCVAAIIIGGAAFSLGIVYAFLAASTGMSWNNPLPRAACGFLLGGAALLGGGVLLGFGIWELQP